MKARCPECHSIFDGLPLSRKCAHCGVFSMDWFIYDWDSYYSFLRILIMCNWFILFIGAVNVITILVWGLVEYYQLIMSLFIVPSIISLLNSYEKIANKPNYQGHQGKDITSWIPLL